MPSLSIKIFSIDNFTIKFFSKLLSGLSIGVRLKSSVFILRSLVVKLIKDSVFIRKTVFL